MSPADEPLTPFEGNARTVLAESLLRIDGRTRSKLNQARHAALAEAARPRRGFLGHFTMMPATGAVAAAVLVAVMVWHHQPAGDAGGAEGQRLAVEDMDLLADGEALDLVEQGDGSFYEWAAAQGDPSGQSDG
jgi:hypothetical protein